MGEMSITCLNFPEIRHLASTKGWYELLAKLQEILREHMLFSLKYSFLPWVISFRIPLLHTSTDLLDSVLKKEDNLDFQARRANRTTGFVLVKTKVPACIEWWIMKAFLITPALNPSLHSIKSAMILHERRSLMAQQIFKLTSVSPNSCSILLPLLCSHLFSCPTAPTCNLSASVSVSPTGPVNSNFGILSIQDSAWHLLGPH